MVINSDISTRELHNVLTVIAYRRHTTLLEGIACKGALNDEESPTNGSFAQPAFV